MADRSAAGMLRWLTSVDDAVMQAKSTGKLVLLDFFSPT
jgi:hypothetical protein